MHWTEPATADDSHAALEKKLWDAANMLWAGADLKPSEYSPTVLGLIFLRYADVRFAALETKNDLVETGLHDGGFPQYEAIPQVANVVDDKMIALPGQLFNITQFPVCLWFFGENKKAESEYSYGNNDALTSLGA